jgi:hypothetical protein
VDFGLDSEPEILKPETSRNLTDRRDPVAESELGEAQYYRLYPRRFDVSASVHF